jgi:uncharacterized membrane protein (DUF485 family)
MLLKRPAQPPTPPPYLFRIRDVEDLKKVLLRQKLCTRQAAEELAKIASNENLQAVEGEPEEKQKEKVFTIIKAEQLLLEKYAMYPTMTEFNAMPNTPDLAIKWGATFGVALLVGELILEQVKQIQGTFEAALRSLYLILLVELDNPTSEYMIEPLERAIKVELKDKSGKPLSPDRQVAFKRQLIRQLIEAFCLVSVSYGVMDAHKGGAYSLTPLGRRVMLHLIDAQRYITLISDAHKRFQGEKPTDPAEEPPLNPTRNAPPRRRM